jgi:hypothetical protein
MKFQIHPSDDGRFFVLDSHSDEIMFYTQNKALVTQVVEQMNLMAEDSDNDDLDGMFGVAQIH